MPLPIFLALDGFTLNSACELTRKVGDRVFGVKIHDVMDWIGPLALKELRRAGAGQIWVDAKLHDIPETVGLRAKAIAENGANIITVHAKGGIDMMCAAKEQAVNANILAITELTSLTEEEVHIGSGQPRKASVLCLARSAKLAGLLGLVCSANELLVLSKRRKRELQGTQFFVPGTRSLGKDVHDQKNVDTPGNAIKNGANFLVVGRQVTKASDPTRALDELEQEINQAQKERAQEETR